MLLVVLQGISRPQLYCELIRSCFLGIIDIVSRPDELKWAAFTYLKARVPCLIIGNNKY